MTMRVLTEEQIALILHDTSVGTRMVLTDQDAELEAIEVGAIERDRNRLAEAVADALQADTFDRERFLARCGA